MAGLKAQSEGLFQGFEGAGEKPSLTFCTERLRFIWFQFSCLCTLPYLLLNSWFLLLVSCSMFQWLWEIADLDVIFGIPRMHRVPSECWQNKRVLSCTNAQAEQMSIDSWKMPGEDALVRNIFFLNTAVAKITDMFALFGGWSLLEMMILS